MQGFLIFHNLKEAINAGFQDMGPYPFRDGHIGRLLRIKTERGWQMAVFDPS